MANNNWNWVDKDERARVAVAHTAEMEKAYCYDIPIAVGKTKLYDGSAHHFSRKTGDSVVRYFCTPLDAVSAAFRWGQGKTCILNFASFKEPGGKFLQGSRAQEECLCHESFLYNVLSDPRTVKMFYEPNRKLLNRALYCNRALYTPDVTFEGESRHSMDADFDVLTCAAPNYSAAKKYQNVSAEENRKALESRIRFVLSIMAEEEVDVAILGAFGCGVFGQDAYEVATLMKSISKEVFEGRRITLIFAVLKGKDGNYEKFRSVF